MRMFVKTAAFAAATAMAIVPGAAMAQKTPQAVVVVIDVQKIYAECNACKAAQTQLQSQAQQLQTLAQSLGQPIRTEAEAIQKAVGDKAPDAAMKARIDALQTKQTQANQQLQQREQTFQRNRAYVAQQIEAKLSPIFTQVMQAHGANLAVDTQATLATASSLDVTNEVMAQLNTQLPSVSTTAPPPPAQPASR